MNGADSIRKKQLFLLYNGEMVKKLRVLINIFSTEVKKVGFGTWIGRFLLFSNPSKIKIVPCLMKNLNQRLYMQYVPATISCSALFFSVNAAKRHEIRSSTLKTLLTVSACDVDSPYNKNDSIKVVVSAN